MTERVLIPLPGIGTLSLEEEAYRAALEAGARLTGGQERAAHDPNEQLLDADELATLLKVPVTWLEQAAREGKIPSLQFGRWRRFRRSDVERAIERNRA